MDKVLVDSALQHCCETINAQNIPGLRRQARAVSSGISAEYELQRFSVSVSVDLKFEWIDNVRKLRGHTRVSCNATQLSAAEAQDFAALYQQVAGLAQTLQSYLSSVELALD